MKLVHGIVLFQLYIIKISFYMHDGADKSVAWGCDLTYEYVKINAEYRS